MKKIHIPGVTDRRGTTQTSTRAPAFAGSATFRPSGDDAGAGAEFVEAAHAAEVQQQAALEAAPVEQSYPETLALYVQAKQDQVVQIEDRLESLIDRQQARLQQTQAAVPGRLSLPSSRRAWQTEQTQQQARLQALHARLDAVREIKEGMGLHSPKIEELATRKMRADNPELASDWDAMRESVRRHELLMRKQEQERKQAKTHGKSHTLGLSAKPA